MGAQLNREVALKMLQPASFKHVVAFLGTCEFVQENIIVSIDRTMESMSTQLVLRGGGMQGNRAQLKLRSHDEAASAARHILPSKNGYSCCLWKRWMQKDTIQCRWLITCPEGLRNWLLLLHERSLICRLQVYLQHFQDDCQPDHPPFHQNARSMKRKSRQHPKVFPGSPPP